MVSGSRDKGDVKVRLAGWGCDGGVGREVEGTERDEGVRNRKGERKREVRFQHVCVWVRRFNKMFLYLAYRSAAVCHRYPKINTDVAATPHRSVELPCRDIGNSMVIIGWKLR